MARVAVVQSYPHDVERTGDASYMHALREYLRSVGHDVYSLTTDICDGRSRAYYRSHYDLAAAAWHTRRAVRFGRTVVSLDARQWWKMARRLFRPEAIVPRREGWLRDEVAWLRRTLARFEIDRVILLRDAVQFGPALAPDIPHIVSVPLYIGSRRLTAETTGAAPAEIAAEIDAEVRAFAGAACVGVHSRDDADFLRARGFADVIEIGIGVAPPRRTRAVRVIAAPVVLFVGAAVFNNLCSLEWFVRDVWPRVRARAPTARLRVVGSIAQADCLRGTDNVDAIGFVPELEAEYDRSRLAIAPLTIGTRGMKVKVAEAIAFACPLVTTSLGFDPAEAPWVRPAALVADTPEAFADAIVRLLDDDALCEALSLGGERAYRDHLARDAACRALMERLALPAHVAAA